MSPLFIIAGAGMLLGLGIYFVTTGVLTSPIRLNDALDVLDGRSSPHIKLSEIPTAGVFERLGIWGYQRMRLPLSVQVQRQLILQDRSIASFFAEKAIWTICGALFPLLLSVVELVGGGAFSLWPLGLSVIGAVGGFFIADVRVRSESRRAIQAAAEALFMFFDLVVLERLSNKSATQALQSVSSISDVPIFQRIRSVSDRARLEQVPPWDGLSKLAEELMLPMLADMSDVLKLDEQGASLAAPLRSRVKELRDENLTKLKIAAQSQTERMTLWMTIPTMIFGLIFLTPPLLRILTGSM